MLRGVDGDYPYFTGEETEFQREVGSWPTTRSSRTRPPAQSHLPPRSGLTTIVLSCFVDTIPTLCIDKQTHKRALGPASGHLSPPALALRTRRFPHVPSGPRVCPHAGDRAGRPGTLSPMSLPQSHTHSHCIQEGLLPQGPGQHARLFLSHTFPLSHTFLKKDTQRPILSPDLHGFTFLEREVWSGGCG